jgi:hypothetical protein
MGPAPPHDALLPGEEVVTAPGACEIQACECDCEPLLRAGQQQQETGSPDPQASFGHIFVQAAWLVYSTHRPARRSSAGELPRDVLVLGLINWAIGHSINEGRLKGHVKESLPSSRHFRRNEDPAMTGLELSRSVSTSFLTRGGAYVPLPGLLHKSEGRIWSQRDPPAPNPVLVLL